MGRTDNCYKVLDNIYNFGNDKFINSENKMIIKQEKKEIYKNILILGYGKTGKSIAEFFRNKNFNIYFWDDNREVLDKIDSNFLKYNQRSVNAFHRVFVSPGISKNHKIIKNADKNKIKISSDIELFLNELKEKNRNNSLLAITGTNGKSTIALMIAKALKLNPLANFGNLVLENFPKKNKKIVLELSSFQLEYLDYIKPKVSIISNIKEDHIAYHGSFKNYKNSKIKICKNQQPEDFVILNYDDKNIRNIFFKKNKTKAKVIWVSAQKKIKDGIFYLENAMHDKCFSKKEYKIKENVFLRHHHNKLNFLISYAALKCLSYESEKAIKYLKSFKGLPHRVEYIGKINNIYFYNDSKATNVSATISALESFSKVFLIAGGSSKGGGFNSLVKYSTRIFEAYLIGETANELKKALGKFCKSIVCKNLEEAVKKSYNKSIISKKKYPILLSPACASFDQYKNYESRGNHFKKIFNDISKGRL